MRYPVRYERLEGRRFQALLEFDVERLQRWVFLDRLLAIARHVHHAWRCGGSLLELYDHNIVQGPPQHAEMKAAALIGQGLISSCAARLLEQALEHGIASGTDVLFQHGSVHCNFHDVPGRRFLA
ncbi:hypothetical protein D3C81_996160 [compost metagenome]